MIRYFANQKLDVAIIEAGVGGQKDSTNVFNPLAVICTSIGRDHTETLGNSLEAIASQKANILKENTPFIHMPASTSIREV